MPESPDASDDAALARAIAERDRAALGEAYRRHGGAVWSLARRVCRDPDLAEEATRLAFAELWAPPERFDPDRGRLRTWLLTRAHARAVDAVLSEEARGREAHATPATPYGLESAVATASLSAHVRRAVDQLHPDERAAIQLAYFGGHTYRQAAALLGAPEGTVKSRIRAALDHLRRALDSEGMTS